MPVRSLLNSGAAVLLAALPTSSAGLAQQSSFDGAYRGNLVCEYLSGTAGILRAPLDLVVSAGNVVVARPIFNQEGKFVVGTEIATGSVGADGAFHLTSNWVGAAASFKGLYNGTIAATGGTLAGTQEWTRSPADDENTTRMCYGAYVKAPPLKR